MDALTLQQKKSFSLIQIGAFLEYFDLYLYVHMAVVLNDLFFPKTDPYTASLLATFTFLPIYYARLGPLFLDIWGIIMDVNLPLLLPPL